MYRSAAIAMMTALGALAMMMGCDPGDTVTTSANPQTCEGCHTHQQTLQKYAPDIAPQESEGGG